jgi:hypothetical protein
MTAVGLLTLAVASLAPAADAVAAHPAQAVHTARAVLPARSSAAALAAAASACPAGDVCVWDGTGFTGSFHGISGTGANDTGSYDFTHAESVYNHGRHCTAIVWTQTNFSGTPRALARNSGLSSLRGTDAWHHIYSNSWAQCT